ncbi:hypothetical protein VNO77_40756 [Canavalia gladiata]|uniref:Uncharacterized protein n=1 Tax=Canavalia gladiata TaxID=3824 RepID=A0AAN9K0Y9_CANGL
MGDKTGKFSLSSWRISLSSLNFSWEDPFSIALYSFGLPPPAKEDSTFALYLPQFLPDSLSRITEVSSFNSLPLGRGFSTRILSLLNLVLWKLNSVQIDRVAVLEGTLVLYFKALKSYNKHVKSKIEEVDIGSIFIHLNCALGLVTEQ